MNATFEIWESPIGHLSIAADKSAVLVLAFTGNWPRILAALGSIREGGNHLTRQTVAQLQEYFAGTRQAFDLPLRPAGSDFQRRAWQALQAIPYGETRNYAQQAEALGQPQAARAIGTANGQNPISILIPCHRVIAKSGKLAGYAGGIAAKHYLLQLESKAPELRLL